MTRLHAAVAVTAFVAALAPGSRAEAQVDLSGEWEARYHEDFPERIPGPEIADYLGLPINDAARMRADAWDASLLTLPEHQCKPHPADYGSRGPANLRIWREFDPATQQVVAWRTHIFWMEPERTIWMDGRAHPPAHAAHTWQGFSTGRWDGHILRVTTTHLKAGWIRRNGIPRSDLATLTELFYRHGNVLTLVTMVEDPVYLTEPFVRTTNWVLTPTQQIPPYPCEIVVEVDRPEGFVPHHLPGTNPFLPEFATRHRVPAAAARGGAETMYPEYARVPRAVSSPGPAAAPPAPTNTQIRVLPVQGRVTMLVGPGGNIAVQTGGDGVLLVDTMVATSAEAIYAEVRKLSGGPLRYIINTSVDADHTGGNEALGQRGSSIGGIAAGNVTLLDEKVGAAIVAHDNVQNRMRRAPGDAPPPFKMWPTSTYVTRRKELSFNGDGIQIWHMPQAHTDGDSIVYFRQSDVVVTGDLFSTVSYPMIDIVRGGTINGVIAGLNVILDLTIPRDKQEGGTLVIPGHGRLSDEADVVDYRDMVTIIRDRVQDMRRRGMSVEQVKAARPTRDYDGRYGAASGPWTTDMFVEAVYWTLPSPGQAVVR